ncbi:MAG TPA: rhomboid family intramembrane serine protease [Anaeromyxobacter sp.]|nr:rhomboid family intramembrane serine protease [Anaeromyxobacter sp.]
MYRPRRTRDLRSSFTFGGRIPASLGLLLVLMVVATVSFWLWHMGWVVLRSDTLASGQLWRLLTWPLVQADPTALIFGGLTLYFFGPPLAYDWGERRFLSTVLLLTLGAALITLGVSWVLQVPFIDYYGIWPLVDGIVLLWALRYPDQQILFFFVLPITGRILALLTVATNALFLVWGVAHGGLNGLVAFTPPLAALLIAWALSRGRLGLPLRRLRLAWRDFRLEQQLRRRSRHLKVVRKNGHGGGPPQWMN